MSLPTSLIVTWRARNPGAASVDRVHEIFHSWVSGRALDDVLVDVADYRHVPSGPGLFVIGHACNYQLRLDADSWEFSCQQKNRAITQRDPLRGVFERSVWACRLLQEELKSPALFDATRVRISSYDRRFWDLTDRPLSSLSASIDSRLGALLLTAPKIEVVTGLSVPALDVAWTSPRTFDELAERITELGPTRRGALQAERA